MNANLTPEQMKLLKQLQKQKIQRREIQSKSNCKEIQKVYIETRKRKINELKKALVEPKSIHIDEVILEPPKINKRTRRVVEVKNRHHYQLI